jgi:signal transduction histidine kinase
MIASVTSVGDPVGKRDIAIAAVVSLIALYYMGAEIGDEEINASVVAAPLFLLVTIPLLWRRRAPLAALSATLCGVLLHAALFGTGVIRCGIVIPVVFLLACAAAANLRGREALVGLVLAEVAIVAMTLTDGAEDIVSALPLLMPLTAVLWGIGRVVHSRAEMVGVLEARTSDLRDARDERARLEVAADRARLSTELDELLQRRLAELAELADAGSGAGDSATATVALAEIEREGRRTLNEMRAVVGALRNESSDVPTVPQPALTQIDALLVRAKGAGARLTVEGSPRVLPAGVELSAYRVVEHLLAALDDGPDVDLCVRFKDDALELSISGPARRGSKTAIEQARERVQLQRGTLETTTRAGRSETLVSLPVLAAV